MKRWTHSCTGVKISISSSVKSAILLLRLFCRALGAEFSALRRTLLKYSIRFREHISGINSNSMRASGLRRAEVYDRGRFP